MQLSDEALRQAAQAGYTEAASQLLSRHYARRSPSCAGCAATKPTPLDLTQRTFCKVWKKSLENFVGRSSFSTWVHGIAHHVYVDWRRSQSRTDAQSDDWWESCAAPTASPFEDAAEKEFAGQMFGLVERMEEEARATVHLHYYQGIEFAGDSRRPGCRDQHGQVSLAKGD